ncbi:MAG: DUF2808 domain-containing protein [Crocosphaera sp.]|nr:DUF2808 domain-containing protein [Crocosphaera sp.]
MMFRVLITSMILMVSPVLALDIGSDITLFNKSPRLVDLITTLSRIRVQGATYYVTVELPPDIDESLQQLTIQQTQGIDTISFYLEDTIAFEGKPLDRHHALNLARVKRNLDNNQIAVIFDPPIPPGKTFTVAFKPKSNPAMSGNYQFAVTAYPAGKNPQGLYLGLGRLFFEQKGDRFP